MTTFRKIESGDVDIIRGLYNKYPDFPKPLRSMLPGEGLHGYVALKDDKIVAATYAFLCANAPYAWLEWTVADKDYKDEDKHQIVVYLLEYATDDLSESGFKWCFAFSNKQQGLIPIYKEAGFDVEGQPAFEMIKDLDYGK